MSSDSEVCNGTDMRRLGAQNIKIILSAEKKNRVGKSGVSMIRLNIEKESYAL